jgi:DNA replication protein DnaC
VDLLLIDDLDKAKFTPSYAEALFELIETRTSENRPTIVTCQLGGAELLDKLSHEQPSLRAHAEAIVRRLRDFSEVFDFDAVRRQSGEEVVRTR